MKHDGGFACREQTLTLDEGLEHFELEAIHILTVLGVPRRNSVKTTTECVEEGHEHVQLARRGWIQSMKNVLAAPLHHLEPVMGFEGRWLSVNVEVAPNPCGLPPKS